MTAVARFNVRSARSHGSEAENPTRAALYPLTSIVVMPLVKRFTFTPRMPTSSDVFSPSASDTASL